MNKYFHIIYIYFCINVACMYSCIGALSAKNKNHNVHSKTLMLYFKILNLNT